MTKPIRTPATYADLEKVPPHLVTEIIHGVLETHPCLDEREASVELRLVDALINAGDHDDDPVADWLFLQRPSLVSGDSIVRPAIAGSKRIRMARILAEEPIEIAPDWVCEFVMRSNAKLQREAKRDIYRQMSVPHHWLFNASYPILDTFRLDENAWFWDGAAGSEETFSIAPFDALTIRMTDLLPPGTLQNDTAGNA